MAVAEEVQQMTSEFVIIFVSNEQQHLISLSVEHSRDGAVVYMG